MKTIKVKAVDFWDGMDFDHDIKVCPLFWAMNKHYNVQFCDNADDANYILCSTMEEYYEYCNYPQVRIMYSAENYIADFNLIDYCISPYPIQFLDRHFCLPACFSMHDRCVELENKHRSYDLDFIRHKEYFANFIVGHRSEEGLRETFFEQLSKYKRVESPGRYLNNRNNAENFLYFDPQKIDFQRKCKFTICFESTYHEGFVTEKILDAFLADTIPIYYGSNFINTIFNERAFINVSDYDSFGEAIKAIIEIDQDDELYLEMLKQPIFRDGHIVENTYADLEKFVCNIFDQPLEQAYRRSLVYLPKCHNQYIKKLRTAKPFIDDQKGYIEREFSGRELVGILKNKIGNSIKRKI